MEYKNNDKVIWFIKNKSGFGKIIGKIPLTNKFSGWIIINNNNTLFDSGFPTIIAYNIENSKDYNEVNTAYFKLQ